jgi:hypothetical protein
MRSASGRSGGRRPEKRVTARSKLPQKKVHRARLTDQIGAKLEKDSVNDGQDAAQPVGIFRLVGGVQGILDKPNGIGNFGGMGQIFTAMPSDFNAAMNSR